MAMKRLLVVILIIIPCVVFQYSSNLLHPSPKKVLSKPFKTKEEFVTNKTSMSQKDYSSVSVINNYNSHLNSILLRSKIRF